MFRKVAIIGVGLIGGSVGLAIKKHRLAREVIGVSRQQASLTQALKVKAIDRASHDVKRSAQDADFVVVATPVKATIHFLSTVGKELRRGALVTDVGSTKSAIVEAAQKHLPPHVHFVGSHPLAGSEKKGAAFSSAELFERAMCLMTPTEKTPKFAVERVKTFWTKIGSNVRILSPSEHDKILAYISHLPHLLAYGLMGTVPQEFLNYAPQGLKDTSRIAASDPEMWRDICLTNTSHLVKSLDEFIKILSVYRKAIVSRDEQILLENFRKSKSKRDVIEQG